MHTQWIGTAAAVLMTILAAAGARAEPPQDVPQQARWYVHIDVQAMLQSAVGQRVLDRWELDADSPKVREFEEDYGFNPLTDLHSVTMYGTTLEEGQGVVVLRGDFDREALVRRMTRARNYEEVDLDGRAAHRFTIHRRGEDHRVLAVIRDEGEVVIASGQPELRDALAVMEGEGEALGEGDPLLAPQPPGVFFQLGVVGLDTLEHRSAAMRSVRSAQLAAGQADGQAHIQLRTQTRDAQTAAQMVELIEGLRALVALRHGPDAPITQAVQTLTAKAEGDRVSADWSCDANVLAQWMDRHGKAWHHHKHKQQEDD
ncbi:MAG TPA: hypothetical protein VF184_04915 [Phycisphaeraceae bacterium]